MQWMLEKYHYRSPAQVRRDFVGWTRQHRCEFVKPRPRTLGRYKSRVGA